MSKRKIEAALRRKGLSCSTLEYNFSACSGGMVGGWEIALDEASENLVVTVDPDFDDLTPDCANAAEVLEWIDTLPAFGGVIDFKAAVLPLLVADLTNHLDDYGEWGVGAGGQDTVDRIAKFIADWTSGEYKRGQDEHARRHPTRSVAVEAAIVDKRDQERLSFDIARQQERKERREAKVFLDGDKLRVVQRHRRIPPWTPKI